MDEMAKPSEEEWNAYKAEISALKHSIDSRLREIYPDNARERIKFMMGPVATALKAAKAGFCHSQNLPIEQPLPYIAYDEAIGSTVAYQEAPYLDFPEPYSIKSLLKRIAAGTEPGFEILAAKAARPADAAATPRHPTDPA